jgi:hypothetical protein
MARLDFHPIVTHPDRAGGLGWLSAPLVGIALFLFAMMAVVAGSWATQLLLYGIPLRAFLPDFLVAMGSGLVVSLAPLCCFAPALYRARLRGTRVYHELMDGFVRDVERRWSEDANARDGAPPSPLGPGTTTALCDADAVYQNVERMRLLPFEPRDVLSLLLGLLLPMVPLLALEMPVLDLLRSIGRVLLGGPPV